ncbi:hypothetical protein [Croceitalea rosinachiae]|uniref:SbsA Ig-like domain-containing protein n=1 Tax=Croceitalea rosinachiae TaxID=3075596 RepID=A0ABU3ACW3_9FLAO|nr:hypothetical protein [Croceitalea sp. F388]MDT0607725.1 hypothetical protein [Croceitalea sp. F388]
MNFYKGFFLILVFCTSAACNEKSNHPFVQAVYPSSDKLPDNLLRIYIKFSKPMKTVNNLEKIKLMDGEGNIIENVFFNNVYELWNKEQKQLTLILDPARVKTGLHANMKYGRALIPGQNYKLIIDNIEDVNHQKMITAYTKKFTVESSDLTPPDIDSWNLGVPKSNTKDYITVYFPSMLDYFSLEQRLVVTDAEKNVIKGDVSIGKHEKSWLFTPDSFWREGEYFLFINTRLEDPSGNNLNGLFDHKIGALKYEKEGTTLSIPFQIKNNK